MPSVRLLQHLGHAKLQGARVLLPIPTGEGGLCVHADWQTGSPLGHRDNPYGCSAAPALGRTFGAFQPGRVNGCVDCHSCDGRAKKIVKRGYELIVATRGICVSTFFNPRADAKTGRKIRTQILHTQEAKIKTLVK